MEGLRDIGYLSDQEECDATRRTKWVQGGEGGMGTATLEAKLTQQLACLTHEPLFQVFLDVRKVYDSLDRGQCMEIMRGYGTGKRMARIIAHH